MIDLIEFNIYLSILGITLVSFLINFFIFRHFYHPSTDHLGHIQIIRSIKRNKNRFILSNPLVLGQKNFAYPQLFHWFLSYLPEKYYTKNYFIINAFINSLSLFIFLLYSHLKLIEQNIPNTLEVNLVISLILFLTPYNYCEWNAKNHGINVRGFGYLISILFSILIIEFDNSLLFSGLLVIIYLVSIMSSQFTNQFILFNTILLSIYRLDIKLVLLYSISILLYYILTPNFFRQFVKGQIIHKNLFFKYLLKDHVYSNRKSIWLDFLIWPKKIKKNIKTSIYYILYNPIVMVLICCSPFIVYIAISKNQPINFSGNFTIIYSTIIISFLTSIGKMRALGEPERYIEFIIPFTLLLAVPFLYENTHFLHLSCIILLFLIINYAQIVYAGFRAKTFARPKTRKKDMLLNLILDHSNSSSPPIIFSNGWQMGRYLSVPEVRVVSYQVTSLYLGKFHFKQLFHNSFLYIDESILDEIIKEFNVDYFVIDHTDISLSKIKSYKQDPTYVNLFDNEKITLLARKKIKND